MGKLFAVLGDIHANLDALEAVLADCREQGVTDYLCTGDVVGYNARPHECLEIVRNLGCPVVMGNHDHYVSSQQNLDDFNPHAAAVIQWTRGQLSAEEMDYLKKVEKDCGRPLTDSEVFGFAQINSEHCRHKIFGGVFVIDGEEKECFFLAVKVGEGDAAHYERYGFVKEEDQWKLACIQVGNPE